MSILSPDQIYGDLFKEVQLQRIFEDNKTFADAVPKEAPEKIVQQYQLQRQHPGFSLLRFVREHFELPKPYDTQYYSDTNTPIVEHLEKLWNVLKRAPNQEVLGSSLLALPFPYIVPGGRFDEIYYWDSYFTMLGLQESGEYEMIENMIKNFAFMIDRYGHIPNGNRSYFLSRSQPPYFSLMLELLAEIKGEDVYLDYLGPLLKEYAYWMDKTQKAKHVVEMSEGQFLNRYYDQLNIERQESYYEDAHLAVLAEKKESRLFRDIRSGAESGWDFSSRWMQDGKELHTIETTRIIPIDLNCLLYHLEKTIEKAYRLMGNKASANKYRLIAKNRKQTIHQYCFNKRDGWYYDYNIRTKALSKELTIAGFTPFFIGIAPQKEIKKAVDIIRKKFLKSGGIITSLKVSGEQWDAPNGWAPMQWTVIKGLRNYNQFELAANIAKRWIALNTKVYQQTGKMMEKYNVIDPSVEAGGGEYPAQDGFGWSNGVLLKLIKMYGEF
ncbi:alpha,alpha-trehalase TreF [Olivibacter sp. XZL3]|uniref:alpha,alpha-trehalase TreF n=1 Tax=Olivibacter sp. XZL3 TaxID=1735116 RepID=UPI0010658865|nr:alpha,alpha-trehalase TreF [Olivibacter sp. XZL3]